MTKTKNCTIDTRQSSTLPTKNQEQKPDGPAISKTNVSRRMNQSPNTRASGKWRRRTNLKNAIHKGSWKDIRIWVDSRRNKLNVNWGMSLSKLSKWNFIKMDKRIQELRQSVRWIAVNWSNSSRKRSHRSLQQANLWKKSRRCTPRRSIFSSITSKWRFKLCKDRPRLTIQRYKGNTGLQHNWKPRKSL
jgi:hypothetical protein